VRRILTLVVALLTTVVATDGAAAVASRRVPFGFFGVVMDPAVSIYNTPAGLDSQMALMATSGVESVRTNFSWAAAEPSAGVYNWAPTDEIVRTAANHRLQLLPIVEFTPQWASSHPSSAWLYYAPTDPGTFAGFMTALVQRYGPRGSFWTENPSVPRVPIKYWQIWNEPEGTKYDWRTAPWPSSYTALLRAAYVAVHRADRGAVVVSGALVALNTTTLTQWAEANDLYRAGARRYFDILAVNAFTIAPKVSDSVSRSIEIVSRVRQVMRRHHDGAKPIWVTELTWTAAAGQIPPADYAGFETTPKGQARRLGSYYEHIAARPTSGIKRAFWYTWASPYVPQALFGNPPTFQYTGLVKWQPGQPFQPLPLLSTYTHVAQRFEGCRKTANARTCR
jgi:polysaccharide biosynthesis protein PslG